VGNAIGEILIDADCPRIPEVAEAVATILEVIFYCAADIFSEVRARSR
jgi:hypothetical protein